MDDPRLATIRELVEPILSQQKVELVELSCRAQGRSTVLRLLVDAVGGVTIQQCASANRKITLAMEESRVLEEPYEIEVSSPGLDRPLVSLRDFERSVGEQLAVQAQQADGRVRELSGMLLAVQPEAIVLKTKSGNLTISRAAIQRAVKKLPW